MCVHYDNTVRNAFGDVIQFEFGGDSLDPTYTEGKQLNILIDYYIQFIQNKKGPWRPTSGHVVLFLAFDRALQSASVASF